MQTDVGIRGTAFEQTLVLINNVPLRDPQTGHHSLNLPVPLEIIERIEIVKGPGGQALGGHATGGLINIITRAPEQGEGGAVLRGGSYGFVEGQLWAGTGNLQGGQMLSVEVRHSDGHIDDEPTDFDQFRAGYNGERTMGTTRLRWGAGFERKRFGAFKFFTADFPDQRERTRTRLLYLTAEHDLGGWQLEGRSWWRGHDDWFRTRVGERDFINIHATDVFGLGLSARRRHGRGETGFGVNLAREEIESNALGERERDEIGLWASRRQRIGDRLILEASLAMVDFDEDGTRFLPSAGLNYRIDDHWTAFVSGGRSSRPASWTEQRLVSGGNVGNPELTAEDSRQIEGGLRWRRADHRATLALFERRTGELIDWGRPFGSVTWRADRFDDHRTRGAESEWRWHARTVSWLDDIRLGYAWLDTRLDDRGLEIKYALDHPRHATTAALRLRPARNLALALNLRDTRRRGGASSTFIAARLAWQPGRWEWFVEADNLLDDEVPEAGFAPQPGRWWFGGVRVGI